MEKERTERGAYAVREIGRGVYQIEEYGAYCYLLVGSERALLIDTGTGFGGLAAAVQALTDKPLLVAATHAHPDHIGGRGAFPVLYLPERDRGIARFYGTLAVRRLMFGKKAQREYGKRRRDIRRGTYRTKYALFSNGHVFDLGGKTVRAVLTPGHTRGHCVFLAEEDKLMFTGDDVCRALWMFLPGSTTVETWLAGARKIASLAGTYAAYTGHDRDRLDAALIAKLVATGEELVHTQRNARLCKVRVFPRNYTDHGILYRTTQVRNKRT